jgi:hypothetical protein
MRQSVLLLPIINYWNVIEESNPSPPVNKFTAALPAELMTYSLILRANPEFIQTTLLFFIRSGLSHHRYRKK